MISYNFLGWIGIGYEPTMSHNDYSIIEIINSNEIGLKDGFGSSRSTPSIDN